jgi:hypothetical protein
MKTEKKNKKRKSLDMRLVGEKLSNNELLSLRGGEDPPPPPPPILPPVGKG